MVKFIITINLEDSFDINARILKKEIRNKILSCDISFSGSKDDLDCEFTIDKGQLGNLSVEKLLYKNILFWMFGELKGM